MNHNCKGLEEADSRADVVWEVTCYDGVWCMWNREYGLSIYYCPFRGVRLDGALV